MDKFWLALGAMFFIALIEIAALASNQDGAMLAASIGVIAAIAAGTIGYNWQPATKK